MNKPKLKNISPNNSDKSLPRPHFPENKLNITELIRYAGRNRLCIEINYKNTIRLIEPYSFRYGAKNNILLYAHEISKAMSKTNGTKSYFMNEIKSAEISAQEFQPRYLIDL